MFDCRHRIIIRNTIQALLKITLISTLGVPTLVMPPSSLDAMHVVDKGEYECRTREKLISGQLSWLREGGFVAESEDRGNKVELRIASRNDRSSSPAFVVVLFSPVVAEVKKGKSCHYPSGIVLHRFEGTPVGSVDPDSSERPVSHVSQEAWETWRRYMLDVADHMNKNYPYRELANKIYTRSKRWLYHYHQPDHCVSPTRFAEIEYCFSEED